MDFFDNFDDDGEFEPFDGSGMSEWFEQQHQLKEELNYQMVDCITDALDKDIEYAGFNLDFDMKGMGEMNMAFIIPRDDFEYVVSKSFSYFREKDNADMQIECYQLLQRIKK